MEKVIVISYSNQEDRSSILLIQCYFYVLLDEESMGLFFEMLGMVLSFWEIVREGGGDELFWVFA